MPISRAKPILPQIWELHKNRIIELYLQPGLTLKELKDIIEEETEPKLLASEKQYYRQLNEVWKIRKNLTSDEVEYIEELWNERDAVGKETRVKRYGVRVGISKAKVEKRKDRRFQSTLETILKEGVDNDTTNDMWMSSAQRFSEWDIGTPSTIAATPKHVADVGIMISSPLLTQVASKGPTVMEEASTSLVLGLGTTGLGTTGLALSSAPYISIITCGSQSHICIRKWDWGRKKDGTWVAAHRNLREISDLRNIVDPKSILSDLSDHLLDLSSETITGAFEVIIELPNDPSSVKDCSLSFMFQATCETIFIRRQFESRFGKLIQSSEWGFNQNGLPNYLITLRFQSNVRIKVGCLLKQTFFSGFAVYPSFKAYWQARHKEDEDCLHLQTLGTGPLSDSVQVQQAPRVFGIWIGTSTQMQHLVSGILDHRNSEPGVLGLKYRPFHRSIPSMIEGDIKSFIKEYSNVKPDSFRHVYTYPDIWNEVTRQICAAEADLHHWDDRDYVEIMDISIRICSARMTKKVLDRFGNRCVNLNVVLTAYYFLDTETSLGPEWMGNRDINRLLLSRITKIYSRGLVHSKERSHFQLLLMEAQRVKDDFKATLAESEMKKLRSRVLPSY